MYLKKHKNHMISTLVSFILENKTFYNQIEYLGILEVK